MRSDFDLLLIAQSARMLAQSAARAKFNRHGATPEDESGCARRFPHPGPLPEGEGDSRCSLRDFHGHQYVLDLFSDRDTQEACQASEIIPPDWNEDQVLKLAQQIAPAHSRSALIYGSGLDNRPDLLEKLQQGRRLFGNSADCLRQVNSPPIFFKHLDELDIPHPETCFKPPKDLKGWLVKPCNGEGGKQIGFNAHQASDYYQKKIEGEAYSILFLANGLDIRALGFNTLFNSSHDPTQPFLFAGAINRAPFDAHQCIEIEGYALKLTQSFGLIGLNSMDFMWDGQHFFILEINPRPSATLALYDEDYPDGLIAEHIKACQGQLDIEPTQGPVRAFKVIYAHAKIKLSHNFEWTEGCADKSNPGVQIDMGEPLCCIHAKGINIAETMNALEKRQEKLVKNLATQTR